jgi:hypothetical protein
VSADDRGQPGGLIPIDRLLSFERAAPRGPTKEHVVREVFGISLSRYQAQLDRAIDHFLARALAPDLVARLRALRDRRRRHRFPPSTTAPEGSDFPMPIPGQVDLGELAKERGMARADFAVSVEWKDRADDAIAELAARVDEYGEPVPFTAEDVREIAGDPDRPNAMGGRISSAANPTKDRPALIRPSGRLLRANRPEAHRHANPLWVGTDYARKEGAPR